jgi:hypothetical protein
MAKSMSFTKRKIELGDAVVPAPTVPSAPSPAEPSPQKEAPAFQPPPEVVAARVQPPMTSATEKPPNKNWAHFMGGAFVCWFLAAVLICSGAAGDPNHPTERTAGGFVAAAFILAGIVLVFIGGLAKDEYDSMMRRQQ